MGDLWRAAQEGVAILGLVDGRFGDVPAPWHQEILAVIDRGVRVVGASSMGALRAAELDTLGMVGIGQVYAAFRDRKLAADDEVAVVHGPAATSYLPGSDAQVDIRATLDAACARGLLAPHETVLLVEAMRRIWFPERSRARLVEAAESLLGQARAAVVRQVCRDDWVSVKAADALLLVDELARLLAAGVPPAPQPFPFEETLPWRAARLKLPDLGGDSPASPPRRSSPSPGEVPMPSWFDRPPLIAPDRRPWALSVYVGADNDLASDVGGDIDSMRSAGDSSGVHVAGQVHVPASSVSGRFLVGPRPADGLRAPIEIAPFGPRDSGDPATLTGFLEWSLTAFPADRRVLVLWGHGRGLSVLGDDTEGGWIDLDELGKALAIAGLDTDRRLAILGFDACMMSSAECLVESAPFAEWVVASQQVVPNEGWAYDTVLRRLGSAILQPEELGRLIVDSYVADHTVRRQADVDLALLDTACADDLGAALGHLGDALVPLLPGLAQPLDTERMMARCFRNGDLVDIGDIVRRVVGLSDDRRLRSAAGRVLDRLDEAVVYKNSIRAIDKDGVGSPDEHRCGLSLFWPRIPGVWHQARRSYGRLRFAKSGGAGWVRFLDAALGSGAPDANVMNVTSAAAPGS
ncbi:TfuA-like protein [Geminicoccus roseus]|uniref:TfuA-like protein n=1 Tax=Geminicoccus roseus TaxID=404900 RepID=UPI0003F67EE9|nr:TfuA-like protein [Geminicoccus roseus]